MKRISALGIAAMIVFLTSCNGANDGKANTDTTKMLADTNINKDSVNHINRAEGTYRTDTPNGADTLRTK